MTGTYRVILADPPWRYAFSRSRSRRVENQYPTMTVEEIVALGPLVRSLADPAGCALFLWGTAPKLPTALQVLDAWGFDYKTGAVWDKVRIGMGYWFRGRHEHLLVGTCGRPALPRVVLPSVFVEKRAAQHSRKPEAVRAWIDAAFPGVPKIELFARGRLPPGWDGWGLEYESGEKP